jgi:hypothetical protein
MDNGAKQPRNNRTAHLRPRWKKGQSGNPKGRPPVAKCIPDLLRWSGGLTAPEELVSKMRKVFGIKDSEKITVDQACILRSRMEAMNGDARHLAFWAERTEGKTTDKLEIAGGQRLEIVEEIVDANAN